MGDTTVDDRKPDTRRRAARRMAVVLAVVAVAFYVGIMLIMASS